MVVVWGAKTGLYAVPIEVAELSDEYYHGDEDGQLFGKIVCKNTSDNKGQPAQGTRIYNTDCKSICLDGDSRKYIIDKITEELTPYVENKIPEIVEKYGYLPEHFNAYNKAKINEKAPTMTACVNRQSNSAQVMSVLKADGKTYPIYEVKDGQITIKGQTVPH